MQCKKQLLEILKQTKEETFHWCTLCRLLILPGLSQLFITRHPHTHASSVQLVRTGEPITRAGMQSPWLQKPRTPPRAQVPQPCLFITRHSIILVYKQPSAVYLELLPFTPLPADNRQQWGNGRSPILFQQHTNTHTPTKWSACKC